MSESDRNFAWLAFWSVIGISTVLIPALAAYLPSLMAGPDFDPRWLHWLVSLQYCSFIAIPIAFFVGFQRRFLRNSLSRFQTIFLNTVTVMNAIVGLYWLVLTIGPMFA